MKITVNFFYFFLNFVEDNKFFTCSIQEDFERRYSLPAGNF